MNSGKSARLQPPPWVLVLALLPILGADPAEIAVREGNALFQSGQYEAALRQYEVAAEQLPESSVIEFARGNALFKSREQEQALAAAQRYEDALTLTRAAIGYFRDSFRLDGGQRDARPDLERRPHGQRADEVPRTSPITRRPASRRSWRACRSR